jgi:ACS family glucarate transporter-like MFS transporter
MADAAPPAPFERPTRVRLLVLALACGLSFLLYLHRYVWGFVKEDIQREFGWYPVTLGSLDSLFAASYALGQIPSGVLCDWFGARLLLGASAILWSLALAGITAATGVLSMGAARVAFGAAQAGCYPVLNKVSKNWFPLGMRPAAQGLIATLCGRGGGAACFVLFGTVLIGALGLPWREAVLLLAAFGVLVGALFLTLFRNTPREHPWANRAEANLITAGDPESAIATRSRLNWRALVRSPSAQLLCARAVFSNMADVLYVYWIPLYLRNVHHVETVHAGWMAALPLVGGALGGMFSGAVQSAVLLRTGDRRWSRAGAGLAGKLMAAGLMLTLLGLDSATAVAGVLLAVKFFSDAEQPAEWGVTTDLGGRNAATVFACVNTTGALGGVVAGPLIGFVLQSYSEEGMPTAAGWNAVFIVIALEYLAAALCWLGIDGRTALAPVEERG